MHIHYLQHVPFEALGSMEPYLRGQGYRLSSTQLYLGQDLPDLGGVDWLIVMGGPMGVHDESQYPWLAREKAFIERAMHGGKLVLGICLGAQLIAEVAGAKVSRNRHREIGWFPIQTGQECAGTILGGVLPPAIEVFHWHGDTFEIPDGAVPLAASEACDNQGFLLESRILGLQFHLETTLQGARDLIENCGHELDGSRFVQSESEMLSDRARFERINATMQAVLERLSAGCSGRPG